MIQAITTANTGLDASQDQIDTAGNNLANLNTTGYKANRVLFQDLLYLNDPSPSADTNGVQLGTGVQLSSTDKLFGEGTLTDTGRSLDVAINGNGLFQVNVNGTIEYTRAGSFQINANGQLVTSDGFIVQPPITVPTNYTAISIGTNGVVQVTTPTQPTFQTVGQLTLAQFANPSGLTAVGTNLFVPSAASGQPVIDVPGQGGAGIVQQGFLEGSNVNAVTELTNLIVAQQTFAANSQVIVGANQLLTDTADLVALT